MVIDSITIIIIQGGNNTESHDIEGFVPVEGGGKISISLISAFFLILGER